MHNSPRATMSGSIGLIAAVRKQRRELQHCRELGRMIASSKVLSPAAEERSPAVMRYPIQRHHSIPRGGELIHNSVGGAIVTGFLGLNDRENRRWARCRNGERRFAGNDGRGAEEKGHPRGHWGVPKVRTNLFSAVG